MQATADTDHLTHLMSGLSIIDKAQLVAISGSKEAVASHTTSINWSSHPPPPPPRNLCWPCQEPINTRSR